MKTKSDIKEEIKEVMKKNNVSYSEMLDEISALGRQLLEDGINYMSDEEYQKYQEFVKTGNDGLELATVGAGWTRHFMDGIQTLKTMFDGIDFSRPFRITVDYNPEQPRVIVKKYITKVSHESYSASIPGKLKD